MRDLVYVALTVGFFGAASALVAVCDRIVGPDPEPANQPEPASDVLT